MFLTQYLAGEYGWRCVGKLKARPMQLERPRCGAGRGDAMRPAHGPLRAGEDPNGTPRRGPTGMQLEAWLHTQSMPCYAWPSHHTWEVHPNRGGGLGQHAWGWGGGAGRGPCTTPLRSEGTKTGPKRSSKRTGVWRNGCTSNACPVQPGHVTIHRTVPPTRRGGQGLHAGAAAGGAVLTGGA